MVDATTAIVAAVLAGVAGGFLSSWMKFNASGEPFNGRKHGNALITGALTGMALGLAQVAAYDVSDVKTIPQATFAIGVFTIFLAAAGIDRLRSSGSHMVTNAAEAKAAKKTATTTPPAVTAAPEEKKP